LFQINKIYNIEDKSADKITIRLTDENDPIFQAHFPNNPLLPGFCHIEILSEILFDEIKKVSLLKLRKKTLPKEVISYNITTKENQRKIKILDVNNQLIGTISYEY
jgi:3-hydroxyacyl-[acyl-carrier-protein] dehydratase